MYIGFTIGIKMLKKHFIKAGMINYEIKILERGFLNENSKIKYK